MRHLIDEVGRGIESLDAASRRPSLSGLRGSPRRSDLPAVHVRDLCVSQPLDPGRGAARASAEGRAETAALHYPFRGTCAVTRTVGEARSSACRAWAGRPALEPEGGEAGVTGRLPRAKKEGRYSVGPPTRRRSDSAATPVPIISNDAGSGMGSFENLYRSIPSG